MNEFLNKNAEYFYEYEYPFVDSFLKSIYGNKIIRRYSLGGDGIFNLLYLDDGKIYEIRFKQATKMLENDGKSAFRDSTKDEIVKNICDNLKDTEYTINSGKFISLKLGKYIGQIEIVKKTKEPDNLGKVRINGIWI